MGQCRRRTVPCVQVVFALTFFVCRLVVGPFITFGTIFCPTSSNVVKVRLLGSPQASQASGPADEGVPCRSAARASSWSAACGATRSPGCAPRRALPAEAPPVRCAGRARLAAADGAAQVQKADWPPGQGGRGPGERQATQRAAPAPGALPCRCLAVRALPASCRACAGCRPPRPRAASGRTRRTSWPATTSEGLGSAASGAMVTVTVTVGCLQGGAGEHWPATAGRQLAARFRACCAPA